MQPSEVFYKELILKNFVKLTGKHLCRSPLFNKVASLSPATFLKKKLPEGYFPVNFAKLLRTLFCRTHPNGWF